MKEEILEKVLNNKKNLIISGPISTGKTQNVVFPVVNQIIEKKESLFILDSKEEYINKFYKKAQENGYNPIIINLKNIKNSESWNMLDYPYNLYKTGNIDETIDSLEQIANELFYEDDSIDSFWTQSAADLFIGLVLSLFEDASKEEINLASISNMLNSMDEKYAAIDYVTEYFKLKENTSIAYISASQTVFSPKETRAGVTSFAKQKIRLFVSRPLLNRMISYTSINHENILKKPSIVFFITKEEKNSVNSLCSLFIEQLFSIIIEQGTTNKFNFILDNFDTLINVANLNNMLSLGISKNIKFTIVTKSKTLLEEKYSSYINNLSDEIITTDNSVEIKLGNSTETIDNEINNEEVPKAEITYPNSLNEKTKIFDFKSFVCDLKSKDLAKYAKDHDLENSEKINNMLNDLEEKIAELDKLDSEKQLTYILIFNELSEHFR